MEAVPHPPLSQSHPPHSASPCNLSPQVLSALEAHKAAAAAKFGQLQSVLAELQAGPLLLP